MVDVDFWKIKFNHEFIYKIKSVLISILFNLSIDPHTKKIDQVWGSLYTGVRIA